MNTEATKKILLLSANPIGSSSLRLGEEMREIEEGLKRSKNREQYSIATAQAVRYRDIRRAILEHEPQIIHYSGHGAGEEGLMFEDETGAAKLVDAQALAGLFQLFSGQVECVVLNACYSQVQAEAIAQHIPCVIGMKKAIGDRAAIEFAVGFYDALGAKKSYEFAYKLGCNAIRIAGIPQQDIPTFLKNAEIESMSAKAQPPQSALSGVSTTQFDVFLAHNTQDKPEVRAIALALKQRSIKPWIDEEQIPPGRSFQDEIQQAIPLVKSAAIFIGSQGLGRWQSWELKAFISQCVDNKIPVIPVLLPGVKNLPEDLVFLKQLRWVTFSNGVDDKAAIDLLQWGITGENAQSSEQLEQKPGEIPTENVLQNIDTSKQERDTYIERPPIEDKCYNAIVQPGALIRIKAPQRMGKTLLLEKILDHAREQGYETIKLDLKLADNATLTNLKTFLYWLCVNVSDSLNLEDKTEEYWQGNLGVNTGCTRYFQRYILLNINTNLVFAIDNFERLFEHDNIFSEFCLLLRSWYETAKQGDRMGKIWKKLRLIVVNSTEVYPTLDINRSPFNVGVAVELPEFNQQQIQEMISLYGLDNLFPQEGLEQLISLIGGHPYLVQESIANLKEQEITLEELLTLAPTEQGIFSYHLRQQLEALEKDTQLKESYQRVITADQAVQLSPEITFKLHSLGLVKIVRNDCIASCDLYRQYFLARLG